MGGCYERAPHEATATVEQLRAALFGPSPAAYAHVAVDDGDVVGFALWFLNFSTWRGVHGIYLEDLYVRPAARGGGHGKALLAQLARICVERGYARLDWWVLHRPELGPSREFYRAIGGTPLSEWEPWRLTDQALVKLAESATR
jgi:GNAT superfamily N-acetyltransferase